jgi:hypothetical protein
MLARLVSVMPVCANHHFHPAWKAAILWKFSHRYVLGREVMDWHFTHFRVIAARVHPDTLRSILPKELPPAVSFRFRLRTGHTRRKYLGLSALPHR